MERQAEAAGQIGGRRHGCGAFPPQAGARITVEECRGQGVELAAGRGRVTVARAACGGLGYPFDRDLDVEKVSPHRLRGDRQLAAPKAVELLAGREGRVVKSADAAA